MERKSFKVFYVLLWGWQHPTLSSLVLGFEGIQQVSHLSYTWWYRFKPSAPQSSLSYQEWLLSAFRVQVLRTVGKAQKQATKLLLSPIYLVQTPDLLAKILMKYVCESLHLTFTYSYCISSIIKNYFKSPETKKLTLTLLDLETIVCFNHLTHWPALIYVSSCLRRLSYSFKVMLVPIILRFSACYLIYSTPLWVSYSLRKEDKQSY